MFNLASRAMGALLPPPVPLWLVLAGALLLPRLKGLAAVSGAAGAAGAVTGWALATGLTTGAGGGLGTCMGAGLLTTGLSCLWETGTGGLTTFGWAGVGAGAAGLPGASCWFDSPAQRAERVMGSGGVTGAGRLPCISHRRARCKTRATVRQAR